MNACYRFQTDESRFTVQAFASGLLSFFGHSPTFLVRDFVGGVQFPSQASGEASLEVTVRPESLQLVDSVSPTDREEIEGRMRREVLETALYPKITFAGTAHSGGKVAENRYRALIEGRLALHGVTNTQRVEAELILVDDQMRLAGAFPLRLSTYRIQPVTALAGTIKLKDQLTVSFDLVGRPENLGPGSGPQSRR